MPCFHHFLLKFLSLLCFFPALLLSLSLSLVSCFKKVPVVTSNMSARKVNVILLWTCDQVQSLKTDSFLMFGISFVSNKYLLQRRHSSCLFFSLLTKYLLRSWKFLYSFKNVLFLTTRYFQILKCLFNHIFLVLSVDSFVQFLIEGTFEIFVYVPVAFCLF